MIIMKIKLLITAFILSVFSLIAYSQSNKANMTKYLEGAVPEVEGRVVFKKEYKNLSISNDELLSVANSWLHKFMSHKEREEKSCIALLSKDENYTVAMIDDMIVFSSHGLSFDATRTKYRIYIEVKDDSCSIAIDRIKYLYNKDNYTAEEFITDKVALNKKKTAVQRGYRKWRIKSVDYFNSVIEDFEKEILKK